MFVLDYNMFSKRELLAISMRFQEAFKWCAMTQPINESIQPIYTNLTQLYYGLRLTLSNICSQKSGMYSIIDDLPIVFLFNGRILFTNEFIVVNCACNACSQRSIQHSFQRRTKFSFCSSELSASNIFRCLIQFAQFWIVNRL